MGRIRLTGGRAVPRVAAAALLIVAAQLVWLSGAGTHASASATCATDTGPVGASFVDCSGGQVFNIVPPGSTGTYDSADYTAFQANGTVPAHTGDQEPLYSDLVKQAPNLTAAAISSFYKDASFYTDAAHAQHVESFSSHPGTVVLRDTAFGVPHIFGVSRADTEFGSGYASAEDRLFEMDVLRHVGRAQLTSFIGPSASNEAMDCSVAEAAGYSENDASDPASLQAQVNQFASRHPDPITIDGHQTTEGQQIVDDATAYVAGVNQYIQDAQSNQNGAKLPVEYGALQIPLQNWTPTDIVSTATLVQAIFATGGGNEVNSALLYESLVGRYGQAQGSAMWADFRSQNDPDAPVSIPTAFNYEHVPSSVDAHAAAMPLAPPTDNHCMVTQASGAPAPAQSQSQSGMSIDLSPLLEQLHRGLPAASNELIVDAAHSATGHPIAVFGPQTGYYVPQLLHEIDLHGPGLQARGVSFAGTDVFVELGHGVDYAWSATSAGSDIIDQRLEKLCNTNGTPATMSSTAYIFNGVCTPMYERTDTQEAKPSAGATCPPLPTCPPVIETIQIERTVHGPVNGRTTAVDPATGQTIPVAVSVQRSTWGDELGSATAFLEWNDPDVIHNALDFQRAAGKETGTFNWAYVDSKDIAYYSSGQLPIRNPHVNPNFPTWGTGQYEWQGFVPINLSKADVHPRANTMAATPGVVNGVFKGGFYTNWNNKQAPSFSASDSQFGYGPVYRVQSLSQRVEAVLDRGLATPVDIINAMEDGGTVDLDGAQLVRQLAKVLHGASLTPAQHNVLGILKTWTADPFWGTGVPGAHRRDRTGSGSYEQGNAVAIMDALYPRLTHAIFDPWLDSSQYSQLARVNAINDIPRSQGSAYDGGWEGYLQRALLQAIGTAKHPYSESYCGQGSLAACQAALQGALQSTIDALTSSYGNDAKPADWTCSRSNPVSGGAGEGTGQVAGVRCNPEYDDITFNAIGVGTVPPMPWVNRPTFQQVVQYPVGR